MMLYKQLTQLDCAKNLTRQQKKNKKKQKIFLQVNISSSKKQKGFSVKELYDAAKQISLYSNIQLLGLMGIGTNTKQNTKIEKGFKELKKQQEYIYKNINKNTQFLSIGMSNDYILALQQGATHIRIGTLLYT